ncbi:DotD/TraH family lipoprotein [Alcanivorax sp. 1008]|uniref:DotD/TraH family lipoprotein n=1 Tax=Alcanivorax sp. 1008 TaxID=2816853 RepID=UPI001D465EBD|nr:DotD/TraH family lipoprotein [Alcanivorax sp. 1008]MCC1496713.1 DotD/TraH family lipoprotein [Alcanivorax sp. 1008]
MKKYISTLAGVALLAGCASKQAVISNEYAFETPKYEQIMVELAEDNASLLRALVEIKNAKTVKAMTPAQMAQVEWQSNYVPDGYDKPMSLEYTGPISNLARMAADAVGAEFRIQGKQPIPDVMVRVSARNSTVIDVLRDAGGQMGGAGRLMVMPHSNVIQVTYLGEKGEAQR